MLLYNPKPEDVNNFVNLNLVTHIYSPKGSSFIVFGFSKTHEVKWNFGNNAERDEVIKQIKNLIGIEEVKLKPTSPVSSTQTLESPESESRKVKVGIIG